VQIVAFCKPEDLLLSIQCLSLQIAASFEMVPQIVMDFVAQISCEQQTFTVVD
jgi:hypothetical protein